jgi:hypothetical protein
MDVDRDMMPITYFHNDDCQLVGALITGAVERCMHRTVPSRIDGARPRTCITPRHDLETASSNEVLPDRHEVGFRIAERSLRGVDRVTSEDEIVLVRGRRTKNEGGVL